MRNRLSKELDKKIDTEQDIELDKTLIEAGIFRFIEENNIGLLIRLLNRVRSIDLNIQYKGETPIGLAKKIKAEKIDNSAMISLLFAILVCSIIEKNDLKGLRELLKQEPSIDVNTPNHQGMIPLVYAASIPIPNPEMITVLLEAKASVNAQVSGVTGLAAAAYNKSSTSVLLLLQKKADVNLGNISRITPLHRAVFNGDAKSIKILFRENANVHPKVGDETTGFSTPLHIASAIAGNVECVQALMEAKADINAKDEKSQTPIYDAISSSRLASSDGSQEDKRDASQKDTLQTLLECKSDLNVRNRNGYTPLMFALQRNRLGCIKPLVDANADPNVKINDDQAPGQTPLHLAALYGDLPTVKSLLAHKADATVKDSEGKTALEIAKKMGEQVLHFYPRSAWGKYYYNEIVGLLKEAAPTHSFRKLIFGH